MNIKKTQEFTYFQNKAKHYDNIKKIKPVVKSWRETIDVLPPRRKPHMEEYDELQTSTNLVNTLIDIKHSPRSRVQVENRHTRYHKFEELRKSRYNSFNHHERHNSINVQNGKIGNRILKAKPSVGTIHDWHSRIDNLQSHKKLIRKKKQQNRLSLYSKDQFMPQHYRNFLAHDGSTIILKQKLFQLPKVLDSSSSSPKNPNTSKLKLQQLNLNFKHIIKDNSGDIIQPQEYKFKKFAF